jgi:hypothetical protein
MQEERSRIVIMLEFSIDLILPGVLWLRADHLENMRTSKS